MAPGERPATGGSGPLLTRRTLLALGSGVALGAALSACGLGSAGGSGSSVGNSGTASLRPGRNVASFGTAGSPAGCWRRGGMPTRGRWARTRRYRRARRPRRDPCWRRPSSPIASCWPASTPRWTSPARCAGLRVGRPGRRATSRRRAAGRHCGGDRCRAGGTCRRRATAGSRLGRDCFRARDRVGGRIETNREWGCRWSSGPPGCTV